MDGFWNLLGWLTNSPSAIASTGIEAISNWIGSCYQGACTSYPQEVWDALGSSFSDATSWLSSSAAVVWAQIFYFLPDGGLLPPAFHASAVYFGNALQTVSWLVPTEALIYCLSTIFTIKITLWIFHISRVAISFVRGVPVDRFNFYIN